MFSIIQFALKYIARFNYLVAKLEKLFRPLHNNTTIQNMQLEIIKPDDWHLHLRDSPMLSKVVPHSARQFKRALIMPNLLPPVTTVKDAISYRQRIISQQDNDFEPYMTLYLTDNTKLDEVKQTADSPFILSFKLYPAGATTNSDSGVTDVKNIMPVLESMAQNGVTLCIHGEDTNPDVDTFDRESSFIKNILSFIHNEIPELKITLEHISTKDGIEFVESSNKNVAGSITCHHLMDNRNAMFKGGLRPHNYCLPVLKREEHRLQIVRAATSGNPKFFAGTDSAPHAKDKKEAACGCAGVYTAHAAVELYTEIFDQEGKLDMLERFLSINGAKFYGLEPNTQTIKINKQSWQVPDEYFTEDLKVVPYRAGETLSWKMSD